MSLFDKDSTENHFRKAKEAASKVGEKSIELISDRRLADLVMLAASKQESVNEVLRERGSNYRVADIDIEMGLPPSVTFGIRRTGEDADPVVDHERAGPGEPVPGSPEEGETP